MGSGKMNTRMSRNRANRKNYMKILSASFILIAVFTLTLIYSYNKALSISKKNNTNYNLPNNETSSNVKKPVTDKIPPKEKKSEPVEILLSAAGDCTIGTDLSFDKSSSLPAVVMNNNNGLSYLFKNALPYFKEDDITIVNLETTFTDSDTPANKQFRFKAPASFASALPLGSIEAVNISNNHIYDYLDKGLSDTLKALKNQNVNYFGEGNAWIKEIKGVKFGFLGYTGWNSSAEIRNKMKKDIENLKNNNCIVIVSFHWGVENSNFPNSTQKELGHFAIDEGADLVIGHHPHVIEGIEKYKNKYICYSLGNFCFGGNVNPSDKDTFIFQIKYTADSGNIIKYEVRAVPFSISSVNYINDYCPTPLTGASKNRVLKRINDYYPNNEFKITDSFQ
ncbi:CapA family protein [Clostridium sp. JN-9]|uniref:CapA family protein n=1 Tax=Clostridium sp. JN-9 TaxID=2507159 RepID=UPI000FFE20FC|nr:CapA family protein [Clostridium sp. JN-9]QAT40084.1 CapA family protein [Clostridium sp. JN-9]